MTGLRTLYCAARKEYAEASQYFLENSGSAFYCDGESFVRPFPVPELMLQSSTTQAVPCQYDHALFADVYSGSRDIQFTLEYIGRLVSSQARVVLIPILSQSRVLDSLKIDSSIRMLCHQQMICIAIFGDVIYAKDIIKLSAIQAEYLHKAKVVLVSRNSQPQ